MNKINAVGYETTGSFSRNTKRKMGTSFLYRHLTLTVKLTAIHRSLVII